MARINKGDELPDEIDVLIVGAGPAGHIAAAQLAQFPTVTTRLIERRPGRDLRTNALYLRPGAEQRIDEMVQALRESDARVAERLSSAERAQLAGLLRKLGPARTRRTKEATG